MKAGKGLDERMAEVRVRFKPQAYNGCVKGHDGPAEQQGNELVMRIQPGTPYDTTKGYLSEKIRPSAHSLSCLQMY